MAFVASAAASAAGGWRRRTVAARLTASRRLLRTEVAKLLLEPRRLGFVRRERGAQAGVAVGVDVPARLLRAKDGVAQRLRSLVGELARAERLESNLALVESVLRGLAGPIELGLELVPEWPSVLTVGVGSAHYDTAHNDVARVVPSARRWLGKTKGPADSGAFLHVRSRGSTASSGVRQAAVVSSAMAEDRRSPCSGSCSCARTSRRRR